MHKVLNTSLCLTPNAVDSWGLSKDNGKGKQPIEINEKPPQVDPAHFRLVNSVRVSRLHTDNPTIGLYQWAHINETLYLQTLNPNVDTLDSEKTIYLFLNQKGALIPEVVYKDRYNVDYKLVMTSIVSTYTFDGTPLLQTLSGHRLVESLVDALPSKDLHPRPNQPTRSRVSFHPVEEFAS